jgi:D-serine deaminase-like pyridoxal phosphate-dependent protein
MSDPAGRRLDDLDTPQLLLDLDVLDANLAFLQGACERAGKALRVHFKSPNCPTGSSRCHPLPAH